MDGFLVKPVEASLLVESITLLLAAPRAPRTDVAPPSAGARGRRGC
jgi:hypothetical protein